jgi:hypothetical protein
MTLAADEFIRRFLISVPPHGLQRYRNEKLARCRELLGMTQPEPPPTKTDDDTGRLSRQNRAPHRRCPMGVPGLSPRPHGLHPRPEASPAPSIIDTS